MDEKKQEMRLIRPIRLISLIRPISLIKLNIPSYHKLQISPQRLLYIL